MYSTEFHVSAIHALLNHMKTQKGKLYSVAIAWNHQKMYEYSENLSMLDEVFTMPSLSK